MSSQNDQVLQIVEPLPSESIPDPVLSPNEPVELEPFSLPIDMDSQDIEEPHQLIKPILEQIKQPIPEQIKQPIPEQAKQPILEQIMQIGQIAKTDSPNTSLKKKQQRLSRLSSKAKSAKKINLYKCKVCKTQGKKKQVRMCTKCKFYFHKDCMDPNKILQESKAFICELCERPVETMRVGETRQQKSQQKQGGCQKQSQKKSLQVQGQKQKSGGFLNISRLLNIYRINFKKEEWKRKLFQFYKRYPYCFQKNRVVFPIQDHLLHIYQSIFPSYCKTTTPRPIPTIDSIPIPKAYYNNLFQIEVFFANFWEDFKAYKFFKPPAIKDEKQYNLQDFTRLNLYRKLLPQGMTELYAWMLEFLLRMYLNDIMDRNRIDNMKYISSNPFFNLLATINENQGLKKQFIIKLAPEIIKNIIKIPSFKRSFQCEFDGSQLHQLSYPKILTLDSKINVITKLIRGLCDTDCFKEIVVKKSEMISQLTKEKGETLLAQKAIENQNLPLRQKIKQLQKELKQLAFSDPKEYAKKYELNHKKLQKLAQTHKINSTKIEEHKQKIKEIARKMPFVNSVVKFLGVDRFKSEYFFYRNQKGKIYAKYRESLLGEETDDIFMVYDSKEQVQQLKGWLNAKGTNERSLLFNITNLEQKDLLSFEQSSGGNVNINENQVQQIAENTSLKALQSINREEIVEMLMFCENMFKETLQNPETIQQRQLEFSDIYFKLAFGDQQAKKAFPANRKAQKSQQTKDEHPLKILFSKYPSKLWTWNQKVKKFWFQFLDFCTADSLYETQGNLIILATVWKITIKIYHIQSLRKRQKHEKKRLKQKQLKEKQHQQMAQEDLQPYSTPEQNQSPQNDFQGSTRRLRKRQGMIDFRENHQQSPNDSMQTYSRKEYSNPQESSKISSLPQSKSNKSTEKAQKYESKKLKDKKIKSTNKKLSIESPSSEPNSESQSSFEEDVQQKATTKSKNNEMNDDQKMEAHSDQKSNNKDIFCEQCFENVNIDKGYKKKLIKCLNCPKVYHKKCLDEDDSVRLKINPNDWRCDDCQRKFEVSKRNNSLKLTNDISSQETKRKSKKLKDKEQKIVSQTENDRELQSKILNQGDKPPKKIKQVSKTMKQKVKDGVQNEKSKIVQKAEKKERKKIEQESKAQQTEENSESYEQERKVELKQSKKTKPKQRNNKKEQKQASEKVPNKKGRSKKQQGKSKKQQSRLDMSASSVELRSTRDKGKRKKMVESSDEYMEPNSEEEESASI